MANKYSSRIRNNNMDIITSILNPELLVGTYSLKYLFKILMIEQIKFKRKCNFNIASTYKLASYNFGRKCSQKGMLNKGKNLHAQYQL